MYKLPVTMHVVFRTTRVLFIVVIDGVGTHLFVRWHVACNIGWESVRMMRLGW